MLSQNLSRGPRELKCCITLAALYRVLSKFLVSKTSYHILPTTYLPEVLKHLRRVQET